MINYYTVLGVAPIATLSQIKKAYRMLALVEHPDKGGDPERFNIITKAYETLSDPQERITYDRDLEVFNQDAFVINQNQPIAGYLKTRTPAYSREFKEEHARASREYNEKLLNRREPGDTFLKPFHSECYEHKSVNIQQSKYHDIYSLIRQKELDFPNSKPSSMATSKLAPLTPANAVSVLMNFLQSQYFGQDLLREIAKFASQLNKIESQNPTAKEIAFYEAILAILSYDKSKHTSILLLAIQQITNFAKNNVDTGMVYLGNLFQSKYYRNFVSYVLHLNWLDTSFPLSLEKFNGQTSADELVLTLKEKLINNRNSNIPNEQTAKRLRYSRLLENLEKAIQKQPTEGEGLEKFYRDKAYHILDWIPSLLVTSEQSIIFNTFLQVGICFQIASQYEPKFAIRIADEKMALELYKISCSKSKKLTPDKEFYFLIHSLKYISRLKYKFDHLDKIVEAYQHRALTIANIFPFIQTERSNVAIFIETDEPLRLMRGLLGALNNLIESNEKKKANNVTDLFTIDHTYVTVFYQIYEACLENWFDQHFDPEFEKSIRLKLMKELLAVNRWTFFDLDLNLDSPWIMIDRDDAGWMRPNRTLPYSESQKSKNFTSIDGVEFNYVTGELSFAFKGWQKDDPEYDNLISLNDISELFETNITGAIFSLDPVDADMQYHPFNKMRFAPSQIIRTQLFHSMLITDYLLKFFTIGQEVQGRYPYDMQTLNNLTQNLPRYLKQIIENYQAAPSTHNLHRFWIEAGEINVAVDESKKDIIQYAYDDLDMIVKKHKMTHGINGDLLDLGDENEEEGWDLYILTPAQKSRLEREDISTLKPAIIFIAGTNQFYFLENEEFSGMYSLNRCDHHLKNLAKLKRDENQKVEISQKNQRLIYRITREAAKQTGKSHRYSREFIFAQEFTIHYNEFAQYFPEFGRLRELSKAVALVRAIDNHNQNNNTIIEKLTTALTDRGALEAMRAKIQPEVSKVVKEQFKKLAEEYGKNVLTRNQSMKLDELRQEIGSMTFNRNSTEIEDICTRANESLRQQVISQGGSWSSMSAQVWSEHIEPQIPEWISQATQQKYESCLEQLKKIFADPLKNMYYPERPIKAFLEGDKTLLLNLLVEYQQTNINSQLEKQFTGISASTIGMAINGSAADLNQIIIHQTNEAVERQKLELQKEIAKHEKMRTSFNKLGFAQQAAEIDMSQVCLWVPASIKHDLSIKHSHLVYGGVSVNPHTLLLAQNSLQAQLLANHAFAHQNQVRVNASQIQNSNTTSGSASNSGGNQGGSGGSGGGSGRSNYSPLIEVLKKAQQTPDKPNQLTATLNDGTKVIFRRDIGQYAHSLGGMGTPPVDHYNVEVHTVHKNRSKIEVNMHIVVDKNLNPVNFYRNNQEKKNNERNIFNKSRP